MRYRIFLALLLGYSLFDNSGAFPSPHGESGLKLKEFAQETNGFGSLSTRREWVEIIKTDKTSDAAPVSLHRSEIRYLANVSFVFLSFMVLFFDFLLSSYGIFCPVGFRGLLSLSVWREWVEIITCPFSKLPLSLVLLAVPC